MMQKFAKTIGKTKTEYFIKGKEPSLLIVSGIHGDEFGVISSVRASIRRYLTSLPNFLFIPEMSSSAVLLGTRKNNEGLDLNRSFFDDSPNEEVRAIMEIVNNFHFDICFSFHEDLELAEFYLYDAFGKNLKGSGLLKNLQKGIKSLNINLLNGVDDPNDPTLGDTFVDGYHFYPVKKVFTNKFGFFSDWGFVNKVFKRYINPEIPGQLAQGKKNKVADLIFRYLILNLK